MAIVDTHAHLGPWPGPVDGLTAEDLGQFMKQFGITRCCVASSVALMGDLEAGNQAVAEAVQGNPGLLGYCVLNPNFPDLSVEQTTRHVRRPGFAAVKLHAHYDRQPLDSSATRELVKGLLRYDKPIMVEIEAIEDLEALHRLAAEYPMAKFVIGDMAGRHWQAAVHLATLRTNVVLQCGGAHAERDAIGYAAERIGQRRVIFGSGAPLAHPVYALGMVRDAELPAGMKDRVLQANACQIFGITL